MGAKSITVAVETSPSVRVSFPAVITAKSVLGGAPGRSIVLMLDKNDKTHMDWLKKFHAAALKVLETQWPAQPDGTPPPTRPRTPLIGGTDSIIKDGDKTLNRQSVPLGEKNPEYKGHYIIRAAKPDSFGQVIVVDRGRQELLKDSDVYGGCYCKVNVNVYGRTRVDNPGVSAGLNGVQKWEDGEPFGAPRPEAADMFDADDGADDPANYDTGILATEEPPDDDDDILFS